MSKKAQQIADWFVNGETGLSSECMAAVALGAKPRYPRAPADPADFNRCLKLVRHAPSVRRAFPKIRRLSKQWRATIDHWDELKEMFVTEVGWNWCREKRAERTYNRMKQLGL